MRKILFLCSLLILSFGCAPKQSGYTLIGKIAGESDGLEVVLLDMEPTSISDSELLGVATIKNGEFELTGEVELPCYVTLMIDTTKEGEHPTSENMLATKFYLENSKITLTGHIDTMSTYHDVGDSFRKPLTVRGSATELLRVEYEKKLASLKEQKNKLAKEYRERYYVSDDRSSENMERCIEIVAQQEKVEEKIREINYNFIMQNPTSIIAYDVALGELYGSVIPHSVGRIEQMEALLNDAWSDYPDKIEHLGELAQKARKLAAGEKYPDIELVNAEGEKVMLSEYVPEGKYVLLEFWASWCGPCRGEIPHLREVYKEYAPKGFEIISISLDSEKSDWVKAVEQEEMVWKQLNDPLGFGGSAATYNIFGVPTCIMVDNEGRLYKSNQRGASLNATLAEIYDE